MLSTITKPSAPTLTLSTLQAVKGVENCKTIETRWASKPTSPNHHVFHNYYTGNPGLLSGFKGLNTSDETH